MPSTFDNFTLGTTAGGATPIQTNDYVVGFDTAVLNGERKWPITTLAQSVSSVMSQEITNKIINSFTGTNQSLVTNGYQKLPGGLIVQWGQTQTAGLGTAVTFPMAFPSAVVAVTSNVTASIGQVESVECLSQTTTGFLAAVWSGVTTAKYIAIGY